MSKKSQNEYPSGSRTSWKVVLTYLFVFALSCALFYYIFNLRNNIESQRSNIKAQHDALNWVNQFTKNVHGAQNAANLYAFTEQSKYKKEFNAYHEEIKAQTASLISFEISENNIQMVNEIERLINEGIREKDFQRIKKSSYGMLIRELNNVEAVASLMLCSHMDEVGPYDAIEALSDLTSADVIDYMRRELRPDRCVLSVIEKEA